MTIQDWAAIAEIVGAIAVVASLIYLAIQIRQNTNGLSLSLRASELAAFERNVDSGNRMREAFILNPEVSELYMRGLKEYKSLKGSDKMRFGMILGNVFSSLQGAYVRQRTYKNDPANLAGSERMLDSLIKCRGVREWLSKSDPDWRPEFAAMVKQRVGLFEASSETDQG